MRPLGRTLVVPAVLAVTVVAATACGDSKPSTTSDPTETASSGTAEPTTSGSTVATMVPTSTGTTDTGDVPDCKMYGTEAPCAAVSGCFWYAEIGQCVSDCELIKDEATCKLQDYCEWFNEQCTLLLV